MQISTLCNSVVTRGLAACPQAIVGLDRCDHITGMNDSSVDISVVPARADWLEALTEGDNVFAARFGVAVERDWIGFPESLAPALDGARRRPDDPWGTHLFFDRADGALVGIGGFKGPPRDGAVEIGYAVAPARQGRGIASPRRVRAGRTGPARLTSSRSPPTPWPPRTRRRPYSASPASVGPPSSPTASSAPSGVGSWRSRQPIRSANPRPGACRSCSDRPCPPSGG